MAYRAPAGPVVTPERLILRPEYHPLVVRLLIALSLTGAIYAALGHTIHFFRPSELFTASAFVLAASGYVYATRVVFEIDGAVLRGYRRKLTIRSRRFEHPLADIKDIGLRMKETGDGTATSVVLLRMDGGYVALDNQLLLCFVEADPDLRALREWFLDRRYPEGRPGDLPDTPVVLDE